MGSGILGFRIRNPVQGIRNRANDRSSIDKKSGIQSVERRIQDCHGAIIGNLEILCLRKILRVCWSRLIQVKSSLTLVDSPFSLSPSPTYSLIRTRGLRIEIGQRI